MRRSLLELAKNSSCVAIIGMEKNAGKTTVLNHLLADDRRCISAVTSIGYDGEDVDQVTGTDKPSIYVGCGTLVATASNLLGQCDFTRELLGFTGFHTPMGEVLVLRALSDGYAQIAGPSTTAQMGMLIQMLQKYGATRTFIDGAAARKSTAAISSSDACILATGASFSHDIEHIVSQTKHYVSLLTLPTTDNEALRHSALATAISAHNTCLLLDQNGQLINSSDSLAETSADLIAAKLAEVKSLVFTGAVTQKLIQRLLAKAKKLVGLQIIAEDGTRFMLPDAQIQELQQRGATMFVRRSVNLLAVTVNPVSPAGFTLDSHHLCERLRQSINMPVFDILAPDA